MTPTQTRLARQRLALGITNVGFWVLAASGALVWLVLRGDGRPGPGGLWLVLVGATVAQGSFDLVGGKWLMPSPAPTMGRFLRGWLRGVCVYTLLLAGIGWLSYASFRLTGGFAPAVVMATVLLALARRWVLRLVGGVATNAATDHGIAILVAQTDDPAFTGGIVGWGVRARSLLPASWLRNLPGEELAAESSRRAWQQANGLADRALLFVLGWNVSGAIAGSLAFGLGRRPPAEALCIHVCWMTLWTFGSLLLLPGLSRKIVFSADRAAQTAGHDPRTWIARFPGLVGEDGGENPLVQTIFYPVPSTRRRLQALEKPARAGFVPGNLARSNLYYSWAACTLLGRAVHCNVGRPALWVVPPSA